MLRKVELIILFFLVIEFFIPMRYINPQLKPITSEVFNIVNQYCQQKQYNNPKHIFIYFKKLKEPVVGECRIGLIKYSIVLDPIYWNSYDNDEKFQLLVHEVSHCILFKNHSRDQNNYMYENMVNLNKEQVKEQFIKDLKGHCDKKIRIFQ